MQGTVDIQRSNDTQWQHAELNEKLCQGDSVRAGVHSRAELALVNEAVLRLNQNSVVRLTDIVTAPKKRSFFALVKGALQSFSRHPRHFTINTPYLNGSIEGTEFAFQVANHRTTLTVFEGLVVASNKQGSVNVPPNHQATAAEGQAPQLRTVVHPRDASQWSLYYPPLVALNGPSAPTFRSLAAVPRSARDADYYLKRASLLLSVGQVDEAQADINRALAMNPKAGLAHALRAVIEIVKNDRSAALADAKQAVALAPKSAAAKIALSYAQQAEFRIPEARATMREAVQQNPKDALAWARVAELELMEGNRSQALADAEKAAALNPQLSRTQSTLGYAALAASHGKEALAAFQKAIELDSSDPLPHFGLGLTEISLGHLKKGTSDLEVAVGLNGENGLFRAYLGKAYFQEKRTPLDAQQFQISEQLDPRDPTPYLYDGILKQTLNQPVGALHDMEKSIKLNGNRAVYRSRLLLDSDAAARNVGLARIYDDLGFQQLALQEGYNSVNIDPTNSAAHRFLADSYSVLPRHEIARVSELLQAQLLNPLNLEPVQPRGAQSNLGLISAGGPATASYNEFNSLFKRNQVNAILSGTFGQLGTRSGDAIISGVHNNVSFSLGESRFKTDGFRPNSDQQDNVGDAFIQAAVSPETSVQFEYRHHYVNHGDLNQELGTYVPSLTHRYQQISDSYRGGLRHAFSPSSTLLGSVTYKITDTSFYDAPSATSWIRTNEPNEKAFGAELQYLYRSPRYNITAGVGHVDLNHNQAVSSYSPPLCFPGPPGSSPICFGGATSSTSDLSGTYTNAYAYSNIRLVPKVVLAVGGSWDSVHTKDPASQSKNQFNPKLGVTWQVRPGTTVRAAAFRVLKGALISDQTLEPTQVAGFNQFYDDVASTNAWRYGLALDHKFSRRLFGGVELSRRNLKTPYKYLGSSQVVRQGQHEKNARAYLFMTPSDHVALSMAYQYQGLDQSLPLSSATTSINKTKAQMLPLGIRYFTNSGWTFAFKGTFVHETYKQGTVTGGVSSVQNYTTNFWVADAFVSYRLPRRHGFVSFGATNLFNRHFAYQQVDSLNTTMVPERMIFGRVTFYLP